MEQKQVEQFLAETCYMYDKKVEMDSKYSKKGNIYQTVRQLHQEYLDWNFETNFDQLTEKIFKGILEGDIYKNLPFDIDNCFKNKDRPALAKAKHKYYYWFVMSKSAFEEKSKNGKKATTKTKAVAKPKSMFKNPNKDFFVKNLLINVQGMVDILYEKSLITFEQGESFLSKPSKDTIIDFYKKMYNVKYPHSPSYIDHLTRLANKMNDMIESKTKNHIAMVIYRDDFYYHAMFANAPDECKILDVDKLLNEFGKLNFILDKSVITIEDHPEIVLDNFAGFRFHIDKKDKNSVTRCLAEFINHIQNGIKNTKRSLDDKLDLVNNIDFDNLKTPTDSSSKVALTINQQPFDFFTCYIQQLLKLSKMEPIPMDEYFNFVEKRDAFTETENTKKYMEGGAFKDKAIRKLSKEANKLETFIEEKIRRLYNQQNPFDLGIFTYYNNSHLK